MDCQEQTDRNPAVQYGAQNAPKRRRISAAVTAQATQPEQSQNSSTKRKAEETQAGASLKRMRLAKKPGDPQLRILQLNMGKAKVVNDELRKAIVERKYDFALVQEPYAWRGNIPGMGLGIDIVMGAKGKETPAAAILYPRAEYTVTKITQLCTSHCVCIQIGGEFGDIYLVSLYCQFKNDIQVHLDELETVLVALKNKKVLIATDANAKSHLWGFESDAKGVKLEDFIMRHDLTVINNKEDLPTCRGTRGETRIDVTLVTSNAIKCVKDWKVESWSSSDHRPINVRLDLSNNATRAQRTSEPRFKVHRADWELFTKSLQTKQDELMNMPMESPRDAEALAEALEKALIDACKKAIPCKVKSMTSQAWWNPELTKLAKEAKRAKARLGKKDSGANLRERQRDRKLRKRKADGSMARYQNEVGKAKRQSWMDYVTKEGNSDVWGLPYKIASGKIKVQKATSTVNVNGSTTTNWQETSRALLDGLIPDDDQSLETAYHKQTRAEAEKAPETPEAEPFTPLEVLDAIWANKGGKSPGEDRIESEVLKHASPIFRVLTRLYNGCLKFGVFPEKWKRGMLITILKDPSKAEDEVKSYRPICLLSVLGKTLERLIVSRLHPVTYHQMYSSENQYGFKPERSTEDAIVRLRAIVDEEKDSKYVMAFALDVKGAFDNLWWPSLLKNLKDRGCPKNIYKLLQSYFSDRVVCRKSTFDKAEKEPSKGCPQGSVFGPVGWNIDFDSLLLTLQGAGYKIVAYADDIIVVIPGKCRLELEGKAKDVVQIVNKWCGEHKLSISAPKSVMILLKGKLDITRPPTVKMGADSIKLYEEARYLGVVFGERFDMLPHIQATKSAILIRFAELARMAKAKWGLKFNSLQMLYKCVFLPKATYAAAGWWDKTKVKERESMATLQRVALIWITKAYSTVSHEALHVLAGAMPIELEMTYKVACYNIRKQRTVEVNEVRIEACDLVSGKIKPVIARRMVRETLIQEWQRHWDVTEKGYTTFEFLPSIKDRLEKDWFRPDHYTTQFFTGHGDFKSYLFKIKSKKCVSPDCQCGSEQTSKHILFECPEIEEKRKPLREMIL